MKTVKIELLVRKIGPVLSWEVFLEKPEKDSRVTNSWASKKENTFYTVIEGYPIENGKLVVFVGCEGREGGQIECDVTINGKSFENKIVNKTTSQDFSFESFSIEADVIKA